MSKYILALDQGTTSSRAILFDKAGKIQSVAQKEFKQIFPQSGWVEHNALEIWSSQQTVMQELFEKGISADEVAAIGITNQRETAVIWDRKTGQPVCNAIVWQDRRTSSYCDELKTSGWTEKIKDKTGLVIDAYFSGTKVKWMLENVPGVRERAEKGELAFGTIDSWLVWNLTKGQKHLTDMSNASRTMLFNIKTLDWDEEILELMNIPSSLLPEVRSCSEIYGHTTLDTHEIPIGGMAGDQQAALFGQMCVEEGMVKNTYGTGCFILTVTGSEPVKSENNLLTTIAWQIGDKVTYALEGGVFIGGAVVQWVRDGLQFIREAGEIEALANSVKDNGGVYLVPAFVGLGAPHWDQYARGALLGLTRGTERGHIARATLESICFQSKEVIDAMAADSGLEIKEIRVDGGAAANNSLMQIQSDIMGIQVIRPEVLETTALGAAYFAGLAVGFWKDLEEVKTQWAVNHTFIPSNDMSEEFKVWKKAVERSKNWLTDE